MTKKNAALLTLALLLVPQKSAAITNEQLALIIGSGIGLAGVGFCTGYLVALQPLEVRESRLRELVEQVKTIDNASPNKLMAAGLLHIINTLK